MTNNNYVRLIHNWKLKVRIRALKTKFNLDKIRSEHLGDLNLSAPAFYYKTKFFDFTGILCY